MVRLNPQMWSALAVFALLAPSPAPAQVVADVPPSGITAADPLWNGALVGAAIGTGFAMWDYLIDPSEPGNAVVFGGAIGLGAAVGAGIDALMNRGGKIPHVSPRQARRVMMSPVLRKNRQGALVSVLF